MWLWLNCGDRSNLGRRLGKMADADVLYLAEYDRGKSVHSLSACCKTRIESTFKKIQLQNWIDLLIFGVWDHSPLRYIHPFISDLWNKRIFSYWSCPFSWPAWPDPVIAGSCWFLELSCCWFYKGENCLEAMLGEEENPSQHCVPKQPSIILILSNTSHYFSPAA